MQITPAPARSAAPRALPLRKATQSADCRDLEQIPNIGRSLAADLRTIGIATPADLAGHEPLALYQALCLQTGQRQDPCVLDTFMAAVDFMRGGAPTPWWHYTEKRKTEFGRSSTDLSRLKLATRMPKQEATPNRNMSTPTPLASMAQPD
jgi:hypothetical protein